MPSPSTWFTVPAYRCTASIMACRAGSRSCWAASGSRLRMSASESVISANSTVTCLRSPSRPARDIRLFSTSDVGVSTSGASSAGDRASRRCPHPEQNVAGRGTTWPQAWQVSTTGVPQATQNRAVRLRGRWHLAQRQGSPSSWCAGIAGAESAASCGSGAGVARRSGAPAGASSGGWTTVTGVRKR
jgi:hypothetical protein